MTGVSLLIQGFSKTVERTLRRALLCFGIGLTFVLPGGRAGETKGQSHQHGGHAPGTVNFPVSCSEQAQVEFRQSIALLHHMTYPQAR